MTVKHVADNEIYCAGQVMALQKGFACFTCRTDLVRMGQTHGDGAVNVVYFHLYMIQLCRRTTIDTKCEHLVGVADVVLEEVIIVTREHYEQILATAPDP